jgi:hypothetical protein
VTERSTICTDTPEKGVKLDAENFQEAHRGKLFEQPPVDSIRSREDD